MIRPFLYPTVCRNGLGYRVTVFSYRRTNQRKLLNGYLGQCVAIDEYTSGTRKLSEIVHIISIFIIIIIIFISM